MKINILYISHSAQMYGSEQSLLLLLKKLDGTKFCPVVILPETGPLNDALAPYTVIEIVSSLKPWLTSRHGLYFFIHQIIFFPLILWSVLSIAKIVYKYRIDIIHTNSLVVISGAIAAKIVGIPHIWHIRELLSSTSLYSVNSIFGIQGVINIVQYLSTVIVANSQAVQQCFPTTKNSPTVQVIYNPVDNAFLNVSHSAEIIQKELSISPNTFLVGQVGHITPIKGYDIFIEAASLVKQVIPHAFFIAVGDTPKSSLNYKNRLLEMIVEYKLEGCFKFLGHRQDIITVMEAMDILVLASRCESFGRVLIEASAMKKPIIGTNVGGIPEIIVPSKTGLLVPVAAPKNLAQAIIAIWNNPSVAKQMGQVGQVYVRTKFGIQQYVENLTQLYTTTVR